MIRFQKGDILHSDAQALVNAVNCVGIMGKGLALQFKKAFPENFKFYAWACERGEVHLGSMLVYDLKRVTGPRYIINFPTKQHWKNQSRLEDIEAGLKDLVKTVRELHIQSIAIPPLGCGLGGLNWSDVRPRIEAAFQPIIEAAFQPIPEVHVALFEPSGPPDDAEMIKRSKTPEMRKQWLHSPEV
jgi:O-acetyl-ADP-ribose deacetylase (regulator of RNase III)